MDHAKKSRIRLAIQRREEILKHYNPPKSFTATAIGRAVRNETWCDWSDNTARQVVGEFLKIERGGYPENVLDAIVRGEDLPEEDLNIQTDTNTEGYGGGIPNTPQFREYCDLHGIPIELVTSAKFVNHQGQEAWNIALHMDGESTQRLETIRTKMIEDMAAHAPKYDYPIVEEFDDPEMLTISLNDIHVGKLAYALQAGTEHSNKILEERVYSGVSRLLAKAQAGRQIEKIVLTNGGDSLHTDGHRPTTTANTPQDTEGTWYSNFLRAKGIFVTVIEMCMQVAPTHFVHVPGNHSWVNGTLLADSISSWFRNCDRFTSDVTLVHRKYVMYGNTLIGMTHGDGAKEEDLPDLMKTEARVAWSQATMGVWLTNHIHHKDKKALRGKRNKIQIEKEYSDVLVLRRGLGETARDYVHVEYCRAPTGTDCWHHRNGYDHQLPAIECFLFHPIHGQHGRFTEFFEKKYREE